MFLLKGSARRGTPAPAPPALCAQEAQAAFALAMKELLLSRPDARGCYLDALLCKGAPEGLAKDW